MNDNEVLERRDDVEMIRRDHLWPHVVLPLKRPREGGYDVAVLLGRNMVGEYVVEENMTMFGLPCDGEPRRVTFPDADAVVAAGWMVD